LLARIVTVAAVGLQEVATSFRERHRALATVEPHKLRQAFVAQVPQVRLARVGRLFPRIAEIAFGHDPERTNCRERSAVLAIQFVSAIPVEHNLAFRTPRQFEAVQECVSRIIGASFARVMIPIATVLVAVARVVLFTTGAWTAPQFNPRHVDVSRFVALQISQIKIKVQKTPPSLISGSCGPRSKTEVMNCARQPAT
jgi:hypothetical protein